MRPLSHDCRTGIVSRVAHAGRRPPVLALVIALVSAAAAVVAHPFPPYWGGGSGAAIHYAPAAWPADAGWIGYTRDGADIADKRTSDGSNGGTSPQSHVNVSSGCTDQTLPSVYYAFNSSAQVLYFRWRVQAPPHNYATGPNAGSYSAGSPWSSALWSVFIDTTGDGFRDFAVHLDGSIGGPATSIDRLAAFYSTTKSQSLDYINDSRVKLLSHNPTAFIDGPSGSDRILNFLSSLTPTANWPNGSSETVWDYGTTRATLLNTGCGEYFIDYQIPLAMLDATSLGGPQVTADTPMSLFFATANGLNNPLQKDAVVVGDFLADPSLEVPGGDTITPGGGTIVQPTVQSVSAVGCSATALSATILDTLNNDRTTSVASASFDYYADTNANGLADDAGSSWTLAANASTANNPVGHWTASWNSSSLVRGQYLIGVKAMDTQGNVTWSYLTTAQVNALGSTPPNYANGTGVIFAAMNNTCGSAGPSVSKTVSPSTVAAGQPVTFTVTVSNPLASAITVSSITDTLPAGFTYQGTFGAGTIGAPTTSPTIGAGGAVTWTFGPATIPASSSRTLIFTANASTVAGTYSNSVSAATSYGTLTAGGTQIGVGSPALTLSKSASLSTAAPGDPVTYTITYSNDSPVNVTNAVITDVLPAGLDYVSASNGGSYAAGTRTITWNVGNISSGTGPFTVTVAATISNPYLSGAAIPLVNTADISSTEASTSSASSSVYVSAPLGQLRVQNQGNVSQLSPGGNVIYTLSYGNIGDAAANGVTLTDVIPTGWSFVSATGGGTNASGTVTWNLGSLAVSATGSVTLTLQASNPYTGANPSTNAVTLAASGLTSAIDAYTVSVTQTGQVCTDYYFRNTTTGVGFDGTQRIANTTAVTASDSGTSVSATSTGIGNTVEAGRFYQDPAVGSQVNFSAGSTLTSDIYLDRVNGAGINVTGAVYDYDPTSGTRTLIGSTTQLFNGSSRGLFSFSVSPSGVLQAGHRLLWIYTFAPANSQSVMLYLQFGGTTTNPASGGTAAAISKSQFCTTAPANPVLNKQVNTLVTGPGGTLVYTIDFANSGGTNMTAAQIVETLPSGVTFTSATLNGSAITPTGSGQTRTFAVHSSDTATSGQITAGQSGTLVVNASVTQPFTGSTDTMINAVALTSSQTTEIIDSIATSLERPSVTINKWVSSTSLVPGDTVTYTLQVINGGPGAASNVTVTDVLPATAYFTYLAGSAKLNNVTINPDPVSGGTLTRNIGTVATGASATITFDMVVAPSGAPDGTTVLSNTAAVSDSETSGARSSNTVNATVSTNPDLTFTKTSSPSSGPIAPGSTIVYTLTVANTGSGGATNVRVSDPIPSNTSYNAGTLQNGGVSVTDLLDGDGGNFDGGGNRVIFDVATVAGGASRTFTYTVTVASPLSNGTTTIGSTATVTASNASTRTATASITASAAPVLTLVKSGPAAVDFPLTTLAADASNATTVTVVSGTGIGVGSTVSIGGTAAVVIDAVGTAVTLGVPVTAASGTLVIPTWEYLLDYENTGTAEATNVIVTDTLPAGLTFLSATAGGVHSVGTVTWNLGTLPASASGTLRVRVRPNSAGGYTNAATLASTELPLVTSNSTSTAAGSLSVTKTTTTPNASVSGNVTTATYVIALHNQSPTIAAAGVTIADVLGPGFTYSSTTSLTGATASTSPSVGDSQPTWTGLTIPATATATLTFVARINNVAAGTYQNEVNVTSSSAAVMGFDALSSTAEDVTLAAVLGSTGAISITPLIAPGGTLTIGVNDPDLNTDATTAQTVQVTVVNARTSESETVTLTETGGSTAIFSGTLTTLGLPIAGANNAPPLNVANGDTVTASYADALTGTGGAATLTASSTVAAAVNSNPTANNDAATVAEDSSATVVNVLANDSAAPDTGETLTVTAVTQGSSGGTVTLVGGVVSYTPAANVAGTETFTYTISDGNGGTATGTVTMTVTTVNDNPTAAADAATVAEDSSATVVNVLANDSTVPDTGETLTVTAVTQGSSGGTVTLVGGVVSYTPAANVAGTETFTYTISDGNGGTATGTVTMTVTNGNDTPTANTDAATVAEDASATVINVLANDSAAPDTGETLTVTAVTQGSSGGTVTLVGGVVSYTPAANFAGTETFTYTISDGNGGTATGTVTMTVTNGNDTPMAAADTATVAANSAATSINVLANDSSAPDTGETLTISAVTQGTNAGVITITGSGTGLTYQPAAGFSGTETFTYTISDGNGGAASATVTLTVTAASNPVVTMTGSPLIYVENSGAVAVDTGLTVTDIDSPNLDSAVVRIASNFAAGQDVLALVSQNGITGVYDASTGVLTLTGSATLAQYQTALRSITYLNISDDPATAPRLVRVTVNDGTSDSNVAARSLVPQTVNDAPKLDQPAAITVDEDSVAHVLTLTGISSGAVDEAQALTVTAISGDSALFTNPTISYTNPSATATLTLTPLPDAFGTGTLTVTVSDGGATNGSITRTITVTIRPINDQPTLNAIPDRSSAVIGTMQSVSFGGIGTGAANETQTLAVTAVSSNPSVVANPVVTYSSASATGTLQLTSLAPGSASISVTVSDGGPENSSVTRTFRIGAGPNAPPTLTTVAPLTMIEGNTLAPATFAVDDDATPVAQLTVTATSSNAALVAPGDLVFGGTGANRTITVTPRRFRIGETVITLTVSDGELTTTTTFPVSVRPLWDYYLTEGATNDGFVTDIRVTNPHEVSAPIRITFVRDDGTTVERTVDVPAVSRHSIRVNELPEVGSTGVSAFIRSVNDLPLLVERTMLWGDSSYGGHSETALESTNTRWYFADGAQSNTLSTRLVIANPNFDATNVRVTFLLGGRTVTKTYMLSPVSRKAIALSTIAELVSHGIATRSCAGVAPVADWVCVAGGGWVPGNHPLAATAGSSVTSDMTFGIIIESDLPTVAERSMYFDGPRDLEGGSVSAGVPYPATDWYFAEGSSWRTFSTYVLVANPNSEAAHVTITYHTMAGLSLTSSHNVGAHSRITVDTLAAVPRLDGEHYWMQLSADQPVVAERTMYWDRSRGPFIESHNSHGVYEPAIRWSTGDARVGGSENFSTFLLLANPSADTAELRVIYHRDSGVPIVTTRTLGGGLRANIHVNADVPQLTNESFWATIESTNGVPIVVERSVYWNTESQRLAGGTNVLALPILPESYSGCEFAISPQSVTAPAAGTTRRIHVGATSRCTYAVASSADWMVVTSGASGNGAGVVELVVAPNASGVARTGHITVAGRVIGVSQGAPAIVTAICAGSAPGSGWVCATSGAWVPPDHPLARVPAQHPLALLAWLGIRP